MEEIELRELFYVIWRRLWIIVLITVLSVAASGVVSYFVLDSEYETFTTLMLSKPTSGVGTNETIQYNDVLLNQKLVSTYGEIAKSRVVSNEVISNLGLSLTPEQLRNKVNVSLVKDTEIIKIVVNDNDPELAARIANETAKVFNKNVVSMMKIENVQVIDKAEVPINPVKPRPIFNMAIAGILGVIISVFLVFVLEYMDNTIKTPSDVERYLDLPVIGMIPKNSGN
ncbi:Wzz/FepE/Etk N-terminal domain-containing protein [Proteiniborus sp.]|uniref:YveK family protein n=1 Tax=Proteiniborus sp. TaxID=2079015 RepID=UPI00331FC2B5